jgi:hypothetical protein
MFTEQQLSDLAKSSALFSNPPPTEGNYTPTLILGLGGTGIKTLRYLKKHLRRNDTQELALLGIDSDSNENEKYSELPKLSDNELCIMDATPAVQKLAQAREHPEEHRYLLDFLPFDRPDLPNLHYKVSAAIRANTGAAQFRRAGRLIFTSNATGGSNLYAKLSEVREQLRGIVEKQAKEHAGYTVSGETRIFVVSSLAGGTGAGSLLDCLALLRLIFDGPMDKITVFSVLPGDLLDRDLRNPVKERPQTRANAIGLLRELQAFRLGQAPNYRFDFGNNLHFDSADRPLLDGNYLVDNRLYDGTDLRDFLDICNAVALFIYSFVGTGVGSEEASGSINSVISDNEGNQKIPRCFQALGIAALAYPVDDLEIYCLRFVLTQWLGRWLNTEIDTNAIEQQVSTASTSLNLDSGDTFRLPFKIEIPGWSYFDNQAEQKELLSRDDDEFLAQKNKNERDLDTTLRQYERQIENQAVTVVRELLQRIDQLALNLIGTTGEAARHLFTRLLQQAQVVAQATTAFKTERKDERDTLENNTPGQERWINALGLGMDRWMREDYIKSVRRLFELKYEAAFDRLVEDGINQVISQLQNKLTRIEFLQKGFALDLEHHQRELASVDRIAPDDTIRNQYGVVQQAMPFSAFAGWVGKIQLSWPDQFVPGALTREALVETIWRQMHPPFKDAIVRLDLLAEAEREQVSEVGAPRPLISRIKSLDESALPTIKLVDSAPRMDEMVPQKYVAGKDIRTTHSSVTEFFEKPTGANRDISRLNINSQHILICTQTYEGYGAAHWGGFDAAYRYYEKNIWYSHVLPDGIELPPLEALSDSEVETDRTFGLALLFELVLEQSTGFYLNFAWKDRDLGYLTYRAEPNPFASQIAAKKIILPMEDSTRSKPDSAFFLGIDLESALIRFRGTAFIQRQVEIGQLADQIQNSLGTRWLRESIGTFLADYLGKRVATRSGDKTQRDKMTNILKSYANRLT